MINMSKMTMSIRRHDKSFMNDSSKKYVFKRVHKTGSDNADVKYQPNDN